MNYSKCMIRECKVCRNKLKCFKEEVDYSEYSKNKHRKTKSSRIQSKKRPKTRGRRISKNQEKHN